MGLHFSRIWERMFGKKEMRILMVGLDAAGKVRQFCARCSASDPEIILPDLILFGYFLTLNRTYILLDHHFVQA